MLRRDKQPNRAVEELLHHSPVTGMLDGYLLSEIRLIGGSREEMDAAENAAMQMSWHLHAVLARPNDDP